jgi:DNA modification methylase
MEPKYQLNNRDCIAGMAEMPEKSVHLVVTSIPFEELFTYSGKVEDVGNNGSTVDIRKGRFALNMRFVVEQLFRVVAPGCNVCIHIQQLLAYKVQHQYMGRRDFRGSMIDVFGAGGFDFYGEFVIPKNPQAMAQRLNLHSLMFATAKKNGSMLAPAVNDYVLIFHKPGEHPHPPKVMYDRKQNPGGWVTSEEWIRDAHGIWSDIQEIDVLDGARGAKEHKHEKHVCPLQLEVIRRCIRLYTNPISIQPDVTVLDPFMGIGSTAYVAVGGKSPMTGLAVEEPRNVVGFELKESYHRASLDYVSRALKSRADAATDVDLFTAVG